jgi:hypothetical protein
VLGLLNWALVHAGAHEPVRPDVIPAVFWKPFPSTLVVFFGIIFGLTGLGCYLKLYVAVSRAVLLPAFLPLLGYMALYCVGLSLPFWELAMSRARFAESPIRIAIPVCWAVLIASAPVLHLTIKGLFDGLNREAGLDERQGGEC